MEGKLQNFDQGENDLEKLTEKEDDLLTQIENRYQTAESISTTSIEQVKEDFENLYDTYDSLPHRDTVNKEKIKNLLNKMKDIYPDVKVENKDSDLEKTYFPETDIEKVLKNIN